MGSRAAEALQAFLLGRVLFLLPAYAWWYSFRLRGLPVPAPPGYVETGQGWLGWDPLNLLVFYDSVHYLSIAAHGYTHPVLCCWFPLYPLAVRVLGAGALAAVLVSNAALFFAVLAARRLGGRTAMWAMALNPVGLLTSAVYSESLFLALTSWAMVWAEEKKPLRAAVAAGLAALTRPVGWAVLAGLAASLVWRREWRSGAVVACLGGVLGVLYPVFLWTRFGDPLLFAHANARYFGRSVEWPLAGVLRDLAAWNGMGVSEKLLVGLNLVGGTCLLWLAVSAKPWVGAAYALLVLGAGVNRSGYVPATHGLLRYAAGCFPWCLGTTGRMLPYLAVMGMVVSLLLAGKLFIF
ncbi:MAG: hypothetical protein AB1816_01835 [Bacillota bacterium]